MDEWHRLCYDGTHEVFLGFWRERRLIVKLQKPDPGNVSKLQLR